MKKTYKIEVDCANCANLMEQAARKTEGVQTATVNFMTQKMTIEFAEGADVDAVKILPHTAAARLFRYLRDILQPFSVVHPAGGRLFPVHHKGDDHLPEDIH